MQAKKEDKIKEYYDEVLAKSKDLMDDWVSNFWEAELRKLSRDLSANLDDF